MSEFDWAKVKFVEEDLRATVPTSHFKVVVNNLVKPEHLVTGSTYKVFWSPDDTEGPMDVKAKGNEILDIDDLPELERKRRRKNHGPLKGFYNALLLSFSADDGKCVTVSSMPPVWKPGEHSLSAFLYCYAK